MNNNQITNHGTQQYIVDGKRPGEGEYLGTGGIRRCGDQTFVSQYTNPRPYHNPQPVYITVNKSNPFTELIAYEIIPKAVDVVLDIGKELFLIWSRSHVEREIHSANEQYKECATKVDTYSARGHSNVEPFPQRKAM